MHHWLRGRMDAPALISQVALAPKYEKLIKMPVIHL